MSAPGGFDDTSRVAEMFSGPPGEMIASTVDAVGSARAMGADDPMIWAIIIGAFTVMSMTAGRNVLNTAASIWSRRTDEKLAERRDAREREHELFLREHRLKHYAAVPPEGES